MTERMLRLDDGIREIYLSFEDGKSVVIESVDFDNTPVIEPAPPKDWAQQMKDLEERNIRLSRFILDWLGRELDIFPEGALSLDDILPTVTKSGGK